MTILKLVFWPWLVSRVWVAMWVYAGHLSHPFRESIPGGYAGVSNWWLNAWTNFDSVHYLSIAREGYTPQTATFYPLYPMLLKVGGGDENMASAAGILFSNLALLWALALLWRLTALDYGPRVAAFCVWMTAFWPTSAFFSAVYTESVFLLFFVAAFWNARGNRWGRAALWALAAALTKNIGFLIAAALWLTWIQANRSNRESSAPHRLAIFAPCLPLAGFIAVQWYLGSLFGALSGVQSQQLYGRAPSWPWIPLWKDTLNVLSGRALELTTMLHLGLALAAIAIAWRDRKRQPLSYTLLLAGLMLMQLGYSRISPPHTIATARYLSTCFPFLQRTAVRVEALCCEAPRLRQVILALIYALVCAVMSYLFGQKSFLG